MPDRKKCFECGELFIGDELVCDACAETIHDGFKMAVEMSDREKSNLEYEQNGRYA